MSFINDMFGDVFSVQGNPESFSEMLNRRVGNAASLEHHEHISAVKYFTSPKIPLRLLQFSTPWAVHAALRFLGEAYVTDQVGMPQGLGKELPVLIDGNHVCGSTMTILHHLYHYKHHTGGDDVLSGYIQLHLIAPVADLGVGADYTLLPTIKACGIFGLQWHIAKHIKKQSDANPYVTSTSLVRD